MDATAQRSDGGGDVDHPDPVIAKEEEEGHGQGDQGNGRVGQDNQPAPVMAVGPDTSKGGYYQLGNKRGQGDDHEGRARVGPEGDKPDYGKLNQARSQDRDSLAAQESGADALPAQRLPLMITLHARKYNMEAREGVRGRPFGAGVKKPCKRPRGQESGESVDA